MPAFARASLLVSGLFLIVLLLCFGLQLRQAGLDIQRELASADSMARFLAVRLAEDPHLLQTLESLQLRHLQLDWGDAPEADATSGLLAHWLAGEIGEPVRYQVALADGRQLGIRVTPLDELEEIHESLLQLLLLFATAWLLCLSASAWLVRRGLHLLAQLRQALQAVAGGALATRLPDCGPPEAGHLAQQFNQMAQALQQASIDNQTLTRALLATQEHERTQLAQALHDDLGQMLAGLRAQLYLLVACREQPQQVARLGEGLLATGEQMQLSFRSLVRDLYPVMLQHAGLVEALRQQVGLWQERHGLPCHLQLDAELPPLDSEAQAHVYRLVQEALTNIARHAAASQVQISLRCSQQQLQLQVVDDGCGLPQPLCAGVGLHSMHERARSLGGQLQLSQPPGGGLCLRVEWNWQENQPCTS